MSIEATTAVHPHSVGVTYSEESGARCDLRPPA